MVALQTIFENLF